MISSNHLPNPIRRPSSRALQKHVSDDFDIIEKFHVRPVFDVLALVEPDAVTGVTGNCDGVVDTIVPIVGAITVGGTGRVSRTFPYLP